MTVYDIITTLGGVALFLFGMNIMGDGLEKMSGGRLERILERLTSSTLKAVLLGAVVTSVIQSSSATTVMLVGFVNAGIMKLTQAVGVIMGANIGTTVTAWIISLGDIDSSGLLLSFLKPKTLAPMVAVAGIVLTMAFRRGKKHNIGRILIGFGVLFSGMLTMETSLSGLAGSQGFQQLMTAFSNPLLGVLVGAGLTAIIQSSSASVGILQTLSASAAAGGNPILFSMAAPIIMGQNIGTCVTAILASIGATRNAKRTAFIHLYFNLIGTTVFLLALYGLQSVIRWPFWEAEMSRSLIATFHLTFNLVTTTLLLPFTNALVKLATRTLPGESGSAEMDGMLDDRFTPSVALAHSLEAVHLMADRAKKNFTRAVEFLNEKYDEKRFSRLREDENTLDGLEVHINQYLLKLVNRGLNEDENGLHSELLHVIGEIERIGDYSVNIAEAAQSKYTDSIQFSQAARSELALLSEAVAELLEVTCSSYREADRSGASKVEPLEETVDRMIDILKGRHISRLKNAECSAEAGALYLELLINFERLADHCSNIALYIIRRSMPRDEQDKFDMHEYVHILHSGRFAQYNEALEAFGEKYVAPLNGAAS
ncbi:MAG: Na/Pi cotransporter family protein [Oscillospiraceae bacterium]|jgi:phosphate:Na+ symporter|nr:Na/Pi cotransporter family protein [Oscillospiraceae bacterium]